MGFFDKFFSGIAENLGNKLAGILQVDEKQTSNNFTVKEKATPITPPTVSYNLPLEINQALVSLNPYITKFRNNRKEEAVYLLYGDYSLANRWIQETSKPDVFFSNYINAIRILEAIIDRDCMNSEAKQKLHNLKLDYTRNVNLFITRLWNSTLEAAQKLKPEKGKQNKLQKFFDTLLVEYAKYLTTENIAFVNTYKNKSINETPKIIKQYVDCGNYDVSTIESINRIPYNSFDAIRPLQKAATAHKRNGDIELAIACLKKSNEISDRLQTPLGKLMEKEYLRVLNYIALLKQPELVKAEEDVIRRIHPEFWDKRVSNRARIQEQISKHKEWNQDLILINTRISCPICNKYHNKVYSLSGKHRSYPKLPNEVLNQTHECKECFWNASLFMEGITQIQPLTKEELAELDRIRKSKIK